MTDYKEMTLEEAAQAIFNEAKCAAVSFDDIEMTEIIIQAEIDRATAEKDAQIAVLVEVANKMVGEFQKHAENWNPLLTDEYGEIIGPLIQALSTLPQEARKMLDKGVEC